MPRPCRSARRAASPSRTALLHEISQRGTDASIPGEGCAGFSRRRAGWTNSLPPNSRRATSPICPDLIYDRHIGSPKKVYLLPQRQYFCLKLCPRPKQVDNHQNNKSDEISHCRSASPDSRSTASQIRFATVTTNNSRATRAEHRCGVPRETTYDKITNLGRAQHYNWRSYPSPPTQTYLTSR